jgi:hypothetical protein
MRNEFGKKEMGDLSPRGKYQKDHGITGISARIAFIKGVLANAPCLLQSRTKTQDQHVQDLSILASSRLQSCHSLPHQLTTTANTL